MSEHGEILDRLVETTPEIRNGLIRHRQKTDAENPSGDVQLAADTWVDDVLLEALSSLDVVGEFASEERETVVDTGGGLSVAIDPLDGSSNLLSNNTTGTIVGIYDAPLPASGRDLVAAAYVLYGPLTTMTVAAGGDVLGHAIDDGTIVGTTEVTIPDEPGICGFSGPTDGWEPALERYADELRRSTKLRYTGAMVADVEQVLTHGGIVAYPSTSGDPEGILRLQFEANPMAYIVERAGGRSSTGDGTVLHVEPRDLHQRTPVYLGDADLIDRLEETLR